MPNIDSQLLSILEPDQFFGPEDWKTFYGINTENVKLPAKLDDLEKIINSPCPFTRDKKIKETHFLLFIPGKINQKGTGLSIRTLQKFFPKNQKPRFYSYLTDTIADDNQTYADEKIEKDTWIIILKEIIPHSRYETYAEQLTMLPDKYVIPTAMVTATFHLSAYQKSEGKIAMKQLYGRTNSLDYHQRRIFVSGINDGEIFICAEEDEKRNGDLGAYIALEL